METTGLQTPKQKFKPPIWALAIAVAVIAGIAAVSVRMMPKEESKPTVITESTLREIINVSELSTYTAVYNGIAKVPNPDKPEETDYYVAYDAKVYAGINFKDVAVKVDNEEKTIHVSVPEIRINKINVDISSMEFIFNNEKANTSTVSQEAYKACEEDAKQESEEQQAIYELAKQNACNVLRALIQPIVEQADAEFTLVVE